MLKNNSNETICSSMIKEIIGESLTISVNILGLIGNGLCIITFSKIIIKKQSQGNLFNYLLLKSIIDFIDFISNSFGVLYYCYNCQMSNWYIFQIWAIWFYNYVEFIAETVSAILEIAATFDCLITINKTFIYCQRKSFFYLFSTLILVGFTLFYLIFPLGYKIKKHDSNFDYNYNDFGSTSFYSHITIIDSIIRDGIFLLIIITLNKFVLDLLKKSTQRRRELSGQVTNDNNLLTVAQSAERKRMIMIIATGLNYMIGHFINLAFTIITTLNKELNTFCLHKFWILLYDLSYANNIFIYYFFNNVFRRFLNELVPFYKRNSNRIDVT
jgi:hypothetical protein